MSKTKKSKVSKKPRKFAKIFNFDIFLAVILSVPVLTLLAIGLHNKFTGIDNHIENDGILLINADSCFILDVLFR